jgi:hypothetical protein
MKDEGGRMKEKQTAMIAWSASWSDFKNFILHPSSLRGLGPFILQQSGGLR